MGTVGVLRDYLGDPAYPDDFWVAESFEASGVNGALIENAVERIRTMGWEIHAFVVAHRGRLVVERYGFSQGANPDHSEPPHQVLPTEARHIYSSTKSFLSALYGIALDEGAIQSLSTPAAEWFPDYESLNPSAAKSAITLADLLTMRSGLELTEPDPSVNAVDPARAALSAPVVATTGETWNYSSGNSAILAEILHVATSKTPLEYADETLFGPLGISSPRWDVGQTGTNHGGFGLWLTAREMARFGELYRNAGTFRDTQVVPAAWTTESTQARCPTDWGGEYAYHFWVPTVPNFPGAFFNTLGAFGQVIYVSRSLELVVVFTAELPNETANLNFQGLIGEFIAPAVQ
jgi:CubicO group peptidase (beta-lactamase class C family)